MLETGILLLFLVPGLAAYASVYGLFHSGKPIAPEPPSANTVEAVVIIAGASLVVHAFTALLFALNGWLFATHHLIDVPRAWLDPYGGAIRAVKGGAIGGAALSLALTGVVLQGLATYVGCRSWLAFLAARDRLPAWVYGWATALANALDNEDRAVIAYVLTTFELDGRGVGYGGMVHDIALKPDGAVVRITLTDCERYLIDLTTTLDQASLSDALSRFSFMVIDAENIRNIAFEMIDLGAVA